MNTPTLFLKLLAKLYANSNNITDSTFKKIGHTIDKKTGEEVVNIQYRFRRANAAPVVSKAHNKDPRGGKARTKLLDMIRRDVKLKLGKI